MDFEHLTLEQVIDLQQLSVLSRYLTSCNLLLELRDCHGRVVIPAPCACGPAPSEAPPSTGAGGQTRQAFCLEVINTGEARATCCSQPHLLVGVPIRPFVKPLGVLLACQGATPWSADGAASSVAVAPDGAPTATRIAVDLIGFLSSVRDQAITVSTQRLEIDNLAQELLERYEQLNFFFDLARQVTPVDGLHPMLNTITQKIAEQFGPAHIITIFHERQLGHVAISEGDPAGACGAGWEASAQQLCQDMAAQVMQTRQPVVRNHLSTLSQQGLETTGFFAILTTPILVNNQFYGTFNILKTSPDSPFYNADIALVESVGKQVGIFIENQQLYQRLEDNHQSQKMEALGRLAGGIAHDFNNILFSMLGYTEMVRDDLPDDSPAQANLERVLKAGKRAKELVKQILTFSRRREPKREPIQIAPIIEEALQLLRASLPASIDLREHLDACGAVAVDPTQLHQVVMNLCTNASHAMGDQEGLLEVCLGDVDLTAEARPGQQIPPGAYVKLTVRDTGCGMPPAVMEHIFDPFFTTKATGKGTGMGLAMVHGIVTSHNGTITVASEPGKGTTFEILFPKAHGVPEAEESAEAAMPTGNERILLVDDEEDLVRMGQQMLERLGYEVVATTSSVKALEAFCVRPDIFDAVITDYMMPDLSGEQLAREMLSVRPDIPIILVTGFSQTMDREQARAIGFRDYVRKPVEAGDLGRVVRRVLDTESGKRAS